MYSQEKQSVLKGILQLQPYYNVATCLDGQPWNTPVWAIYDVDFNLYWSSWKEAVHSKNIAKNPNAFLTIFDSTRERGTNNFRCLYLNCDVKEVSNEIEALKIGKLLYPDETFDLGQFLEDGLKRFYKAAPRQAWINCLSEKQLTSQTVKMRTEISLDDLRAAI